MLLTIVGAVVGGVMANLLARCLNLRRNGILNDTDLLTIFGLFVGGGIGFGYGSALLMNSSHPYNKMINLIKQ